MARKQGGLREHRGMGWLKVWPLLLPSLYPLWRQVGVGPRATQAVSLAHAMPNAVVAIRVNAPGSEGQNPPE